MTRPTRRALPEVPSVGELLGDVWDEHGSLFAVYYATPNAWREAGRDVRTVGEEVDGHLGSAVGRYAEDHPLLTA